VEQFLTAYGVQGGVATYRKTVLSARFQNLDSTASWKVLLVCESVPSIEEKYNGRMR
jgi:hypothetical protein